MGKSVLLRGANRILAVLLGGLLLMVGTFRSVEASCLIPREPIEFVTAVLAGEQVEPSSYVNLGGVLGAYERETIRRWDAIPDYTAASAIVVTRYWGEPPPADRLVAETHGGHFTGPSATEPTISCDPSVALPEGTREFIAIFESGSFVPTWGDLTAEHEATLTALLGDPVSVQLPDLRAEHPQAGEVRAPDFGDVDDQFGARSWVLVAMGATGLSGLIVWWVIRVRSRPDSP